MITSLHNLTHWRRPLVPLRALRAIAASGAHVELIKYSDDLGELTWYSGALTGVPFRAEDCTFGWARLIALRGDLDAWERARLMLSEGGFVEVPRE